MMSPDFAQRPPRILIVAPAPAERAVFRGLLAKAENLSGDVIEAADAAAAKSALAAARPDCVLLDYDLPGGNGLELLGEIVSTYGIHAFGIVMLMDASAPVAAVEALRSGAHDFLLKGNINAVLFQQGMRNAIEKAAIHRELETQRAEITRKNDELEKHIVELEREAAERRRAELALKDSQAFLQSVVGATTDCLKVLDLDGRILWMSENGRRMIELDDAAAFQNRDWSSLWTRDGKEEQARAAVAAAREGRVARLNGSLATMKTGTVKWWDVLVSPITGRNGRPEKILCVSRDVSDMRQADAALRESEAQLRLATAAGKVGVWNWDIVADKVTWSESLYAMHGIEPREFRGTVEAFAALVHPDDAARVHAAIRSALAEEATYELEFRAVRPDGEIVWFFTSATVLRKDGRPVNMLGASLDITERKRAERHTEFLASLGQRLGLLSDPMDIIQGAQETVGRHLDAHRCFFLEVDEATGDTFIHADWHVDGLPDAAGRYSKNGYGERGLAGHLQRPQFAVDDVATDPAVRDCEAYFRGTSTRAFATAAHHREGRWVGCLGVESREPRRWRADELKLLEDAVVRVWPLIEKARADRLLLDSAEQLRLAAMSAKLGTWRWNAGTDALTLSPRAAEIFGVEPGARLSWSGVQALLHEEDRERARKAVETAMAAHADYAVEYRVVRPGGSDVWVAASGGGHYDREGRLAGMVGVIQDVTQRKKAESATRQLAAIVQSSEDAIVSKNLRSEVLSWNAGAERLFGYTEAEMIGTSITVLIPAGQYDEEPRILDQIRRGERIEHYETIRRHKSGRLIDVSLTVSPMKDENGVIVGASKIARDISARKATERALTRRTHTLETLNRVGEALVAEREMEKVIQLVADAAREITGAEFCVFFSEATGENAEEPGGRVTVSGLTGEELARLPVARGMPAIDALFRGAGTRRSDDISAAELSPGSAEAGGGGARLRSYLAVPVKSGSGEILGGLFLGHPETGFFTDEAEDVIEGLAAQAAIAIDNAQLYRAVQRELAEHKMVREAVRAREQQLRLVTNNAPVFLLQCDREYRYTFANEPYAARYGFTSETLQGRTIAEVTGRAAFEAAKNHIDAALAGERVEFEMEIPYAALGSRWVHVTFVPELDPAGNVLGFVGVLTDITQRKSAELELERARDEALAASRAKDDFLAALSHELRTPLNPVLLLASDAAENASLAPAIRESFETIRRQVNLEARLIDDLLDLTRITRGKLSLDRRIIDAHAVVKDALETVRPEVEAKGLVFELTLEAPRHMIFGDAVRLQQVVWNVLKNAVKFTGEGGRIFVRSSEGTRRNRLRLEVRDSGIGLTREEIGRIFEAFSQGEHASGGSHRFGGLGLGLAISRSIVEMHGGEISAKSEGRNRGATFIIELPLMSVTTGQEQQKSEDTALVSPEAPSGKKRARLLVIEDHGPTRATLKSLLERRNFEVLTAGSAIEARELAQQYPPALVISDIGLPDADGCVLMKELRAVHPALPGIALSGYGMEEDLARTREAGFLEHLTKPVNVGALERAIERIFSNNS